ncbi:two-component sensor histidine kinase [Mycoplana sp. BE70]|uniref:sensor histidine kinase n=1 Tax=Mycoplana sp. BE70 TaxID=2817775 RepID=UPI002855D881|nr:PAS domain-containing protein [Mycoplana sp. BE70]MDR6758498.1 two-component sensor histidine kinase [Mycoplana sp. BE70]
MVLEDLYRLLKSGHVQAQGIVDTMTQPVIVLDHNLLVTSANNAFFKAFQVQSDDILGEDFFGLGNGQWDIPELRQLISSVIPKAVAVIGFEVKHDFPTVGQRTFLVDARRLVHPNDNSTSILVMFDDVTDRQRHDAEREFVLSETRHRMKNLLAVVRAIALRTDVEERTALEYRDTFLGRLEVTLRAQDIASSGPIDFEALLRQSIGEPGVKHLRTQGPAVQVESANVPAISMIFHELATNAVKYGALSVPAGEVHVRWQIEVDSDGRDCLLCEWREQSGPPVTLPGRKGYGTELIEGTSAHLGGAVELNYRPSGLIATLRIPM